MVITRSQKRNLENDELYIINDNSNINYKIKKIKTDNETSISEVSTSEANTSTSETETSETSETETGETETETETIETETSEIESNTSETDETKGIQKILNLKLKPAQIQHIIKESIKTLVKRYNDEDRDFLEDNENKNEDYDKFMTYIDGIHSGDFFERIPIEERSKKLKATYDIEQIKKFNEELEKIHKMYNESAPSIIDILKMDVHVSQKQKLLEKIHNYTNSEVLTNEYKSTLKYLMTNINKTEDNELYKLEQEIIKSAQSDELCDDYRKKILKSNMSFENKVIAYKRLEIMERYEETDSSEYAKYKNWMDILLSIPFGKYINIPTMNNTAPNEITTFINKVRNTLDERLSFLEKPKDQIINIVSQMIRKSDFAINAIGLHGQAGLGKTSICKSIAEALGRPYRMISLGGESDSSMLSGHNFTYIGSSPGRIIDILSECKCMNPVILFDEIDKVSQTHHGKEIIGTLIHLTDYTTNKKYNYDRYFAGIEFDLSKILFVFTYNDPSKVDRVLADRLFKIKVDNYNTKEKLEITTKHIINNALKDYNLTNEDICFPNDVIEYIVNSSKSNVGMRDIKRKIEIIVSRINTLIMTSNIDNIIRLKYKMLKSYYNKFPVTIKLSHIDTLLSESATNDIEEKGPPMHMYI
jgi:ATP-dependent Lon protease